MFHNISVLVPSKPHAYLNRCYGGEDWRKTVRVWTHAFNQELEEGFNPNLVVFKLEDYSALVKTLGYVAPSAQGNYRDSLDLLTKNGDVDNVVDKEKEVARSLALMANRKVARRNERLLLQRGCQDSRSRES